MIAEGGGRRKAGVLGGREGREAEGRRTRQQYSAVLLQDLPLGELSREGEDFREGAQSGGRALLGGFPGGRLTYAINRELDCWGRQNYCSCISSCELQEREGRGDDGPCTAVRTLIAATCDLRP
ncbi:unnamed protein product [Calypogeia fissa]